MRRCRYRGHTSVHPCCPRPALGRCRPDSRLSFCILPLVPGALGSTGEEQGVSWEVRHHGQPPSLWPRHSVLLSPSLLLDRLRTGPRLYSSSCAEGPASSRWKSMVRRPRGAGGRHAGATVSSAEVSFSAPPSMDRARIVGLVQLAELLSTLFSSGSLCLSARGVTRDYTKCSLGLNTRPAMPGGGRKPKAGAALVCPGGRTHLRFNRNTTETLPKLYQNLTVSG